MKILIAGGSGHLGRYLLQKINKNKEYHSISMSRRLSGIAKTDLKCNFLKEKFLEENLKYLKKKFNKIDCIIFSIGESSKKKYNDKVNKIKINFLTFKKFLKIYCRIFQNQPTKIIVISSAVTEKHFKDAVKSYVSSKQILKEYTKKKSKELASKKININLISPGNLFIEGNNWSKRLKKDKEKVLNYIEKNVPIKKFIKPKIIYKTCKLIINDKENFYTGSNFIIDGGQSL